jgi:hypothetical protein
MTEFNMRPLMSAPMMQDPELMPEPPPGGAPWLAIILVGMFGMGLAFTVGAGLGYAVGGGPKRAGAAQWVRTAPAKSDAAAVASARLMTQTLRSQLALYKLQHNDENPTLAQLQNNWSVLLQQTNARGSVMIGNGPGSQRYGPYLQSAPVNPLNGQTGVCPLAAPHAGAGWAYDETTGQILPVAPTGSAGDDMADGEVARVPQP